MHNGRLDRNFFCAGILPLRHFRFVLARNAAVANEIGGRHGATTQVSALIAETLLGAFFLAARSIKQEKLTVSVQLDCKGPAHRIVAFASAAGGLRAVPSRPQANWPGNLYRGKGTGVLSVHRWLDENRRVYSSSVEMRDTNLAQNFQEYMARSDQVQCFLDMEPVVENGELVSTSGYLFEALPEASATDIDSILDLLSARTAGELVDSLLPGELNDSVGVRQVDVREKVNVLRTGHFFSYCNCSRQKMENMLFLLGREEVMDLVLERGTVEVFCEFCKRRYELEAADVVSLFEMERDRSPEDG